MDINTNFIAGRMNKSVDERLIPPGEYKNALNVRLGSTETTDIGAVENSKGNSKLTTLEFDGNPLSSNATCIGAYADAIRETMYWFVHDKNPNGTTVDLIVSYNSITDLTVYHVVSLSVLSFNPLYLITGVQLVEELLFFTDNINPPRVININRNYPLPSNGLDNFIEEDISLIVRPPGFSKFVNAFGNVEYDLATPVITLLETTSQEENFLKDRFLSFAYRYRYNDKQYSATSLFSEVAFQPSDFNVEPDAMVNEGMLNRFNAVGIAFSTGPKNVLEIDLLYKESTSNVIYIVERFIKKELGWQDNEKKSFIFSSNKVYGTLGSDELFRQYDNVPLKAKALTIQGNRVMLANYTEGYDIATATGEKIPIDFIAELEENVTPVYNLGSPFSLVNTSLVNQPFTYEITGTHTSTNDFSTIVFSLESVTLPIGPGTDFIFPMQFYSYETSGDNGNTLISDQNYPIGSAITPLSLNLRYNTGNTQYNSVAEMLNAVVFRATIEGPINQSIPNVINQSLTRGSLMALFNREIISALQSINTLSSAAVGVEYDFDFESLTDSQNIQILNYSGAIPSRQGASTTPNCFSITFPAVRFDPIGSPPPSYSSIYNYFRFVLLDTATNFTPNPSFPQNASYSLGQDQVYGSLHSNRDYEVGVVYMDEYGRATTALVSSNNTVFVPSKSSINQNKINVSVSNKPPFWANKYKFVLKASRAVYNTIFCTKFYPDKFDTSISWFALEGEDKALVKEGTQLVVKTDSSGVLDSLSIATVLEVRSYLRGELVEDVSLGGFYMSIKPNNFTASYEASDTINWGKNPLNLGFIADGFPTQESGGEGEPIFPFLRETTTRVTDNDEKDGPWVSYPLPQYLNGGDWALSSIPQGAIIKFNFRIWRSAYNVVNLPNNESINWEWNQTFVSPVFYNDFRQWFIGENIATRAGGTVNNGETELNTSPRVDTSWIDSASGNATNFVEAKAAGGNLKIGEENHYRISFIDVPLADRPDNSSKRYYMQLKARISGFKALYDNRPAHVDMKIEFAGQNDTFTFETTPLDADPNLFYDTSQMLDIELDVNGELAHKGNIQNQIISSTPIAAISQLPFFNCYSFGNGVESYRIEDSVTGKDLSLGQRTTAISIIPYAQELRQSSITYSGIYYPSSGLNNSNEFNLGLVNFSDLETNFGPVMKLHSRETDILVLQEDRISYVLSNKNIISDSVGGGAIVSVPTVLGKQIARIEEYGISFNPESFTSWGKNIYFSDTKRGAILQLTGGSLKDESLTVISDTGMRSYFRDKFISQLNTQKLGGYDPYMDEYVFSSNTTPVPINTTPSPCGRSLTPQSSISTYNVSIEIGQVVGEVNLNYNINNPNTATLDITANFNGVDTIGTALSGAGNLKISKTSIFPTTIDITVIPSEECTYTLNPNCLTSRQDGYVTQYVLMASPDGNNEQFHFGYEWTDGVFTSPESNDFAVNVDPSLRTCTPATGILNTIVNSGFPSAGLIPYGGTTINMYVDKQQNDSFGWNPSRGHKMYAYTQRAIQTGCFNTILSSLTGLTPLTVINTQNNKYVGKLENLRVTGSTYLGVNDSNPPQNNIASSTVDFTTLSLNVNDSVISASGATGKITSITTSTMLTLNSLGNPQQIVSAGEAYTITRINMGQTILVYDMRNKVGVNACSDTLSASVCNCSSQCVTFISTTTSKTTPCSAFLESSIGTLNGRAHSGLSDIPQIGEICYADASCSPNNLMTPGWYWAGNNLGNNSDQVILVDSNGICINRLTQNC